MAAKLSDYPHPCFNEAAKGSHGRVHLPVAPKCNIRCNYCNRKYDCLNESRPGVSSGVLKPHQARAYLEEVLDAEPRISVAGIAGPGDAFANAPETLETVREVLELNPEMLICLASNGLGVSQYLDEIADAGVTHMTLTVNAVDSEIGQKIYAWVRDGKVVYRGRAAAELLLKRQEEALTGLKERGITVKLNTIVIPGINDEHVEQVAIWGKRLGADLMNLMPLYPTEDTKFADVPEPSRELMLELRAKCEKHLPQMKHCTRCRADAVGILGQDRSGELAGCLSACSKLPKPAPAGRPYVAVASREGTLINLHLGQARELQIWAPVEGGYAMLESRIAPPSGEGELRWKKLAELLHDCRAVLVSGVGQTPRQVLEDYGIEVLEMGGFIDQALGAIYKGEELSAFKLRKKKACCGGGGADGLGGGDGMGCL